MAALLFCPFCREAHEGLERCPEHELRLLPWHELPREAPDATALDRTLASFSPAYGRGVFAAGGLVTLIAFLFLPLGTVEGTLRFGGTMVALAASGSARLFLVPAALAVQLGLLARRRTPRLLQSARLAALLAALVPLLACGWAYAGAVAATSRLTETGQHTLELAPGAGLYAVALGSLLGVWGALRLGAPRSPRRLRVT